MILPLFFVFILVSTTLGQTEERKRPSLTACGLLPAKGSPENVERIPWNVAIYKKYPNEYRQICSGTLISNKIVITAAYCFWNRTKKALASPQDYVVEVGKMYRSWNDPLDATAQKSEISAIKIEPSYQDIEANFQNDIAVVELTTSMEYNDFVSPACICFRPAFEKEQLVPGNKGKVVGWKRSGMGIDNKAIVVDTPLLSQTECLKESPADFREYISEEKICFGNKGGTEIGAGYGGAGLTFPHTEDGITRHFLRAVVSLAPLTEDSGSGTIFIATLLTKHEKLIKDNL